MAQHKIIVSNGMEHVLLYGYFQEAFKVYCGMNISVIENLSYSEHAAMIQIFDSIRNKIRVNTHLSPKIITGLVALFQEEKTNVYPKEIIFSDIEKIWVSTMVKLNFEQLNTFCKLCVESDFYKKIYPENTENSFFTELIFNLRNAEMIDFLMEKFKEKNPSL